MNRPLCDLCLWGKLATIRVAQQAPNWRSPRPSESGRGGALTVDNMNDTRPIEEPIIVEGSVVDASAGVAQPRAGDAVEPLVGTGLPAAALPATAPQPGPADPEFDAYLAVVKLLLGGTIEGTAELARRLERMERELRAMENGRLPPGQVNNSTDVVRYMLVGMALSVADGARRQAFKLAEASDLFWRATGNAVEPLARNRLTGRVVGPFDRAFARLVDRGQKRVNEWVELGRATEPTARLVARQTYLEIVDDFIGQLSQNDQLAELVQEQSMGLATEVVEEVRERSLSADSLAESIVRRILKRPPREALPPPPDEIRQAVAEVKRVPRHDDH